MLFPHITFETSLNFSQAHLIVDITASRALCAHYPACTLSPCCLYLNLSFYLHLEVTHQRCIFCMKNLSLWLNFYELRNTSCAHSVDILYTAQSSFPLLCYTQSKDTFEFAFVQSFLSYKKPLSYLHLFSFLCLAMLSSITCIEITPLSSYHRLAQDHLHTAFLLQLHP